MAAYPRRKFLAQAAAVAPAALLPRSVFALQANVASVDPWARADAIVKRIVAPTFAARDFDIKWLIREIAACGLAVGSMRSQASTSTSSRRRRSLSAPTRASTRRSTRVGKAPS